MVTEKISEKFSYTPHFVTINGSKMHYVEQGQGDPILFLHGIPTSSYVWRNVIPHLSPLGRCIAPDLMGLGQSEKPAIDYSISDHIQYIEKFIEALNLKNITLVMHGFGSIIGFDYAMRHENNCKGLVFYEAFLRALDDTDNSLPFHEQLAAWQEQETVSDLALDGTHFVDEVISQSVMRQLTETEMENYRRPFIEKGTAKPLSQYLKEVLHEDGTSRINQIISYYSEKLKQSTLPKLMLYSVPGFITTIATAMWAKENLPRLEIADIGEELHLAQESYPQLMAETISIWLQGIEQTKGAK